MYWGTTVVDSQCHDVGLEKLGFVAGVDIVLLFLQLEEIMILPGRGDIGGKKE